MTRPILPPAALSQHIAVLGKTGSGKTSTAKLIIEQVVAEGARVCVLDPIKSDWWGLTSSADGKRPGLPFHILGGPRGHVPLHAAAGMAIGEIVASGQLPLSIIDMADFEAGGLQRFFVDFAPTLLRRMRGVLYLVIEEAHEFAPKDRPGFKDENMAIHYAKRLGTGGRSKGIRMIVLSQRTQALHNALLGSCDTMIAHRFTSPADQEPVVKWLKSNLEPDLAKQVASSLSSLKTGEGWLCAGEAQVFERRQFPRIHTYDNTATPTDDATEHEVKTAPVDQDKLRAIIGDAVAQAEADDPKRLKVEIATKDREIARLKAEKPAGPPPQALLIEAEDRGYAKGQEDGHARGLSLGRRETFVLLQDLPQALLDARRGAEDIDAAAQIIRTAYERVEVSLAACEPTPARKPPARIGRADMLEKPPRAGAPLLVHGGTGGVLAREPGEPMKDMPRKILTALAQHPDGLTKGQILVHTGYRSSGPVSKCFADLSRDGWIESRSFQVTITPSGIAALGAYEPLPVGDALRESLIENGSKLPLMERKMLRVICDAHPSAIGKGKVLELTGYASSGPVSRSFAHLVALGYCQKDGRGALKAARELFG